MKNAIILHGTGSTPDSFWLPKIRSLLEDKGYSVFSPQLPHSEKFKLEILLPYVLKNAHFDSKTIIIGHSAAVALILAVLEKLDVKIRKAILVSGFLHEKSEKDIIKESYDWAKIKENCSKFVIINSDNDPWGADDKEGRFMADKLGGILIIPMGEGHMGSDYYGQPYKEFPLLEKMIEL